MHIMKVQLTLTEEALGGSPNDKDVYRKYIASKAPDPATIEDEVEAIGVDGVMDNKITVFLRDKDGNPCIKDHQMKGFFKEKFSTLAKVGKAGGKEGKNCAKLKAFKKAVDNSLFVFPKLAPFVFEDEEVGECVRPLRADTAQGPRVALASSETVPAGSSTELIIKTSLPELRPCIVEALNYGKYSGLLQWRGSGKGTFTWKLLEEYDETEENEVEP